MAYDLTRFRASDMVSLGAALRTLRAGALSMEEVACRIVRLLYDQLIDSSTDERACVLVRFFKSHPYGRLDAAQRACACAQLPPSDGQPAEDMRCLALLASVGDQPEWCARQSSSAHQAIPLASTSMIERLPMVAQLVKQMGIPVRTLADGDASLFVDAAATGYNVFYVPNAVGSPHLPAQASFVVPNRIRSVLGFGGLVDDGELFAIILFARTAISVATAALFRTVALSAKAAVVTLGDERTFAGVGVPLDTAPSLVAPREAALVQLLDALEPISLDHFLRLERALEEIAQQTRELGRSYAARALAEEAQRRSAFLGKATAVLSESLEHQVVLPRLARLVSLSLADWCVIDLVVDGQIRCVAAVHADPDKEPLLARLQQSHPARWGSQHPATRVIASGQPLSISQLTDGALEQLCDDSEHVRLTRALGMCAALSLPLVVRGRILGALTLVSAKKPRFDDADQELAEELGRRAAIAIDNARLYHELALLKDRLQAENLYLQEEIRTQHNFEEIVGQSPQLLETLAKVERVAATDFSVLILGETGTGKELIARAIHNRSQRRDRPLVKVNCGSIPAGIVESELFGHLKGAFTGALQNRIGRFALADGGTLFLDEVGELPLDIQVKLLRVLQEHEFEPLGSSSPQRVDVRVIAATNRDLNEAVRASRFRLDLLYRVNVFPITVPSLRERRADIPILVSFFVAQLSKRLGRPLKGISQRSMERLLAYSWPGNVRELQNVVDRAALLSHGQVLEIDEALAPAASASADAATGTANAQSEAEVTTSLENVERGHILRVLRATAGVIEGPGGAALALGLHPNTLRHRMKKLGISRRDAMR
jgi:transcriptional regulator with GAF, ATPase, and Fis domain